MMYFGSTSFIVLSSLLLLVSCSYQFMEPPFHSNELVQISETDFGKQLLSNLDNIPDTEQTKDLKEGLNEESLVYEISDDFLIQQDHNNEKTGWELSILTKNDHHIVMCSLMHDEDGGIEWSHNVEIKKSEDGTIYFSGEQTELKALALELSLSGPKLCIAVPYADPSTRDDSKISKWVGATPESEVVVEKEIIREVPVEVLKKTDGLDENDENEEGGGGTCGSNQNGTMLAGHYAMIALPFALLCRSRIWRVQKAGKAVKLP